MPGAGHERTVRLVPGATERGPDHLATCAVDGVDEGAVLLVAGAPEVDGEPQPAKMTAATVAASAATSGTARRRTSGASRALLRDGESVRFEGPVT